MDITLDEIDVALLRELSRDGRASRRELAKRLGLSTPTVSARLARLERSGVITGYRAELRPEALGQSRLLFLLRVGPKEAEAAADAALAVEGVTRVLRGADLVAVEAVATEARDPSRLASELGALLGVRSVESVPIVGRAQRTELPGMRAGTSIELTCDYCGGPVKGKVVTGEAGGRTHVFCCATCRREFLAKWARLAAASGASVKGRPPQA